jgi:hypothetical protein
LTYKTICTCCGSNIACLHQNSHWGWFPI